MRVWRAKLYGQRLVWIVSSAVNLLSMCNAKAWQGRGGLRPGRHGLPVVPGAWRAQAVPAGDCPRARNFGASRRSRSSRRVAPGQVTLRFWAHCGVSPLGECEVSWLCSAVQKLLGPVKWRCGIPKFRFGRWPISLYCDDFG